MKEIGGYFGLEQFAGREYHEGLIAVNSARNALAYLLRVRNIQKLCIPYFLCDSVSAVCAREGCPVEFYSIGDDFLPLFDRQLDEGEWLYIVNFYGQISNSAIQQMSQRWKNVIVDNVQAFFQLPVGGVDTVYSCRKFFGVPDGGYVATDAKSQISLDMDVSKDRMKHILGRFEGLASDYHRDFKENDHGFVELPVRAMSKLTHNLLRGVDYEAARQKRNRNYEILDHALGGRNKLVLTTPDGPYCYPLYCENGMEVKKKLAAQKIYVATLWPNVLTMDGTLEKDYAENILPIPCDHRYDAEDMMRIVMEVNKCIG